MQDTKKTQIARRTFLQGAATVVGTTVLGVTSAPAVAASIQRGGKLDSVDNTLSVGYWDGQHFVDASSLPAGDPKMEHAALVVRSYGPAEVLKALDVNAIVPTSSGKRRVPFQACVPGPNGAFQSKFGMAVDPKLGLIFTAHMQTGKVESLTDLPFVTNDDAGLKLKAGTYVIAVGTVNWAMYTYDAMNLDAPLLGPTGPVTTLQYVVITVDRA